eukprot:361604-Chlamydomonas_euryale.AAC.4
MLIRIHSRILFNSTFFQAYPLRAAQVTSMRPQCLPAIRVPLSCPAPNLSLPFAFHTPLPPPQCPPATLAPPSPPFPLPSTQTQPHLPRAGDAQPVGAPTRPVAALPAVRSGRPVRPPADGRGVGAGADAGHATHAGKSAAGVA